MTWQLKKNPLFDTYELKLVLEARISQEVMGEYGGIESTHIMYAKPQPITITLAQEFFEQPDPERVIAYIQRQVQGVWTQAVAGMAGRYTDLIIEALMPTVEQMLNERKGLY